MASNAPEQRAVLTVARLNREVRELLDQGFPAVWVEGEVSNLARPASGHMYFTLKDDRAQVRCAMFRQRNRLVRFRPENGQQILARARISLYEPRGDYQLIVESMEEAGDGALRRQFEALRQKLEGEGLFAPERKRTLPALPRRVGVITSPTGAAIRDVLRVMARRFPSIPVIIYPTPVQGSEAAPGVIDALETAARRNEVDIVLVTRGGGSLEDLWAFNDESLARAIAASPIPVVSAVGHEVDVTIADLVADHRGATPSAAAEIISPDADEWLRAVQARAERLRRVQTRRLQGERQRLKNLLQRLHLQHPGRRLRDHAQRLDELDARLRQAWSTRQRLRRAALDALQRRLHAATPARRLPRERARTQELSQRLAAAQKRLLESRRERLAAVTRTLETVSPLATVHRGYAIVQRTDSGTLVRDATALAPGDGVTARLARGRLHCQVDAVDAEDDWGQTQ